MMPRFLTWRDLPDGRAPIVGYLRPPFRCYFGGKTPEIVMMFEPLRVTTETIEPRPFAVGLEGYIRLEKLFGVNLVAWSGRIVSLRRGNRRGFNYIEVVPELPARDVAAVERVNG